MHEVALLALRGIVFVLTVTGLLTWLVIGACLLVAYGQAKAERLGIYDE